MIKTFAILLVAAALAAETKPPAPLTDAEKLDIARLQAAVAERKAALRELERDAERLFAQRQEALKQAESVMADALQKARKRAGADPTCSLTAEQQWSCPAPKKETDKK